MKEVYAGMDIGSKECAVVAIESGGSQIDSVVFKTSERNMVAFFSRHPNSKVLIEECEMAAWVRATIKPHVASVIVCDPKRNAWVAKGTNKNDRVDAAKLAELNRLGSFSEVWHPDDEDVAGFKVLVKHYDDTSKRLAEVKCQIKARLRKQGVVTRGEAVYGPRRDEALSRVDNTFARIAIEQDYELLDYLEGAKKAARSSVVAASGRFPVIALLKEIPGVGPILAARFVAYVADPHRFNKRTLASYSCLGIVKRSSDGSPLGREHLSKAGNSALKDLSRTAFERAMATRSPNGIKEFYAGSLTRTGDKTKARLNTQRKILALMLAIWRDKTEYRDELVTRAFAGA
jgi:Transposase and inactivated derivatives